MPEEDVFHCRLHVMERETVKMERMSLLYVVCMCNLYAVFVVYDLYNTNNNEFINVSSKKSSREDSPLLTSSFLKYNLTTHNELI